MLRTGFCALFAIVSPLAAAATTLSADPDLIVVSDPLLSGTIEVVAILDEMPEDFVVVSSVPQEGDHFVVIQASFDAEILSIGMQVSDGTPPVSPYLDIPNVTATGYVSSSERILGPDEFFPFFHEWFFIDEGPLLPGESVDLWVSYTRLEPGSVLDFVAVLEGSGVQVELGSVQVVPEPAAGLLLGTGLAGLHLLSLHARRARRRGFCAPRPCGRRGAQGLGPPAR